MSSSLSNSSIESVNKHPRDDSCSVKPRRSMYENATESVLKANHYDHAVPISNAINDNNSSQPDDDGNSTDALADAFSFSLAHIAASHRAATITNSDESHVTKATERYPVHKKCDVSVDRGGDSDAMDVAHRHFPCHAGVHEASSDARPHYHRHHKRACVETLPSATGVLEAGSHHFRNAAPTVVVAPLPLPSLGPVSKRSEGMTSRHGSTSSLNEDGLTSSSLAHPYRREPCFHTIRQTFHMVGSKRSSKTALSEDDVKAPSRNGNKRGLKRKIVTKTDAPTELPPCVVHDRSSGKNECEDHSEMDSGSDGGYSASYSSNGNCAAGKYDSSSCSSDEESTDDNYDKGRKQPNRESGDPMRPMLSEKKQESSPLSSDIADFSSSFSVHACKARSDSPYFTSSSSHLGDETDHSVRRNELIRPKPRSRSRRVAPVWTLMPQPPSPTSPIAESDRRRFHKRSRLADRKPAAVHRAKTLDGKIPILALGCDVMAHVLTFLEPPEVLDVLTMPLSKGWLLTFTRQPELWRVLCLLEPFKAQIKDDDDSIGSCYSSSSDDDSDFPISFSTGKSSKFRLQYASYVRCMRCLDRIKEDAVSGRPLSVVDYAAVLKESTTVSAEVQNFGSNQNLQQFLAQARGYATTMEANRTSAVVPSEPPTRSPTSNSIVAVSRPSDKPKLKIKSLKILQAHQGPNISTATSKEKRVTFGHSKLTQRLLGPTLTGTLSEVELPWTYGIYSIVNWMIAYSDVEGIQTMCLRVLPFLLENEQQRITAQRAGLTDIVLRDMVLFPESVILHTAAFHTIVLLARPLGGQEGMLFHTSMVNSSGIFGSTAEGSVGGKSGIAVLIDSMRRFELNESLQSMACWSLVNIALAPSQKEVLVKLGGIEVIAHAMKEHQYSADVQFRALFALINLVIPSVTNGTNNNMNENLDDDLGIDSTEKEMLDELVDQIIGLVVLAMKNYCSHEAILNRACLVLHNLSLSPCYHASMLWTPNCYQMLEWCLSNYRTDQVLQQSAAGTLHRLQTTLSSDEALRVRFVAKLQTQQVDSMQRVMQDTVAMQGQQ